MPKVEIVPFGGLKRYFEAGVSLDLPIGATIADVKANLAKVRLGGKALEPTGASLLEASAVSTETEILSDVSKVPIDSKILFLLPPVSGG